MNITLLKWLSVVFSAMLLSSFVSMMAAFVGSVGADLRDLLILQTILIPLAILVVILIFAALIRRHGCKSALRQVWNCLPGWLLFAVLAANSLVLIAELSFILIQHHTGNLRPWQEHVPAATALFGSIALASCYVASRLSDPGVKTRSNER